MKWPALEILLQKYERRVEKVKATPDPRKLKSNLLIYELERDDLRAKLKAGEDGYPPISSYLWPPPLLKSLGFYYWDQEGMADRMNPEQVNSYLQKAREYGFPDQICDRTILKVMPLIMGEYPKLSLAIEVNSDCYNLPITNAIVAEYMDIPRYFYDIPYEVSEDSLKYLVDQLWEIKELGEKISGVEYDEDKHKEMQRLDKGWFEVYRELNNLKRQKPSPWPSSEVFKESRMPSYYFDPPRCLEVWQTYLEEIKERARKGITSTKDEKVRLMLTVSGPFYWLDFFTYLEDRGASIIHWQIGHSSRMAGVNNELDAYELWGDETEYGRKLSPMEDDARISSRMAWGLLGKNWVEDIMQVCKEYELDGIIYFQQWGCTVSEGLAQITAEETEKRLGIPTLILEGRQLIQEIFNPDDIKSKLDAFIDLCKERKGV